MVTWGEQDMATIRSRQLQSWHIPQLWAVTVMTPSHCAFVWPVPQLLWIPRPIEWEGFPPQRPSQQTNRPDKQVPTAPASKQLPTVTVWLVLISHKEVLHEALLSLSLSSFTAKFPNLRVRAPNICPQNKTGNPNQKGKIIIKNNNNNVWNVSTYNTFFLRVWYRWSQVSSVNSARFVMLL